MSILLFLGWAILAIIIMIGAWFVLSSLFQAHGQEAATVVPPTAPTVTNQPTPTTPTPNWQFLPQKAYVQPFGPEVGIPPNALPLTSVPQVIPMQPQQVQQQTNSGFDVGSIISMVVAAGSGLAAKVGFDKAKKVQETSQANSTAIVESKTVEQELARLMFEWNKDKADALNETAPAVKLETLKDNVKDATETAAKA